MPSFVPVAAIVHKQRKIVRAFRGAGATSRDRATTAAELGVRESMAFRILRRHGIVRDAGEHRLYLDEATWEAHRAKRRRIAFTIAAAALVVMVVAIVWASRR